MQLPVAIYTITCHSVYCSALTALSKKPSKLSVAINHQKIQSIMWEVNKQFTNRNQLLYNYMLEYIRIQDHLFAVVFHCLIQ